jgi:uncharacterized phage protein (TIGR02218 family)
VGSGGPYRALRITSNFNQVDALVVKVAEGNSTSLTWEGISHTAGTDMLVTNCVVIGSDTANVGAINGIRSAQTNDKVYNCDVYGCKGGSFGRGIHVNGTNADVRDNISVRSGFQDFSPASTFDHNISSDNTATGVGSFTLELQELLFLNAPFGDFRIKQSSHALDSGSDLSATFTLDITGATRTGQWDIGAYNGFGVPFSVPPTQVINSIGSAGGRDYPTIAAWELATRLHLVALNKQYIGECYDDSDFSVTTVGISDVPDYNQAVTDQTRFRILRAATGQRYDPVGDTGVLITNSSTGTTVKIAENYFQLRGVRVDNLVAGTSDTESVRVTGANVVVDAVFGSLPNGTAGNRRVFYGTGANGRFRNCFASGASNTDGADIGFQVTGAGSKVQNCAGSKIRRGASGTVFKDGGGAGGVRFQNCISGVSDVGFNVVVGFQDHNVSLDATAAGIGSFINQSAAAIWQDSTNNDFRLLSTSVCVDAGTRFSSEFTTDFAGLDRAGAWEIGPYNGYLAPPAYKKRQVGRTSHLVSCWTIELVAGGVYRFTDDSSPLVFRGLLFPAGGSVSASTRRREISLREHNVEISGFVSDSFVSLTRLQSDAFANARVTESLVDSRFPFGEPVLESVYYVKGPFKFDKESWTAQLIGSASRLQSNIGGLYTRGDRFKSGDIDFSTYTQFDKAITTLNVARLSFDASSLSGSFADGWFDFAVLTWKTGNNAGKRSEVREYMQATRTLTLFLETPFEIQVGDTFDLEPGYDLSFDARKAKFNDGVNFKGYPFIPGGHRALQTPNR